MVQAIACVWVEGRVVIGSQVSKLQTFEEFIPNNFTLKDAFLHNGKLDDILLCALREASSIVSDCLNRLGGTINFRCLSSVYMSSYSQSGTWSVYIIRCSDSTLYTGISTNVARRFEEHASGSTKSAKYLRGRTPLDLIYTKEIGTQSEATIEERRIKALTKTQKVNLILEKS